MVKPHITRYVSQFSGKELWKCEADATGLGKLNGIGDTVISAFENLQFFMPDVPLKRRITPRKPRK